jgi:hypothetical protein
MNEFTIETATPPPCGRGRHGRVKNDLRTRIEALEAGQVLRWRPAEATSRSRANEVAWLVSKDFPGRKFTVRKENGGFDIYRTL